MYNNSFDEGIRKALRIHITQSPHLPKSSKKLNHFPKTLKSSKTKTRRPRSPVFQTVPLHVSIRILYPLTPLSFPVSWGFVGNKFKNSNADDTVGYWSAGGMLHIMEAFLIFLLVCMVFCLDRGPHRHRAVWKGLAMRPAKSFPAIQQNRTDWELEQVHRDGKMFTIIEFMWKRRRVHYSIASSF